eukprot:6766474-Pyramimonas_sp.AAC.1
MEGTKAGEERDDAASWMPWLATSERRAGLNRSVQIIQIIFDPVPISVRLLDGNNRVGRDELGEVAQLAISKPQVV